MKKKKDKKEQRVLLGAVAVAGVIAAGSTFAWFTSKDEVTNRLSASAEYNVAISETFQPPETWVPGQEINKDASAVNTGNVDAFVRMWLDGNLRMLNQYRGTSANTNVAWTASGFNLANLINTEDSNLVSMGLTKRVDGSDEYVKTLTRQQTLNAKQAAELNAQGYASKVEGAYSEVQAMQSGILAYAPDAAEYTYLLKEETELDIYFGADNYRTVKVPAGTLVHVNSSGTKTAAALDDTTGALTITATEAVVSTSGAATSTNYPTVYVDKTGPFGAPRNVEYESFTPMTNGLYLFLRNENTANQDDPEFSGYVMDGYNKATTPDPYAAATFYALNTNTSLNNRSDYTVKGATTATYAAPITVTYDNANKNIISAVPSMNLELYNAKYETAGAHDMTFYADAVDTTTHTQNIYAVYDADNDNTFNGDKDIVVVITAANVGISPEGWTSIGATNATTAYTLVPGTTPTTVGLDASKLTFYYNNDVEAGDSTAKLVDKVKLYEGVTQKAYLAFDFDLNVHLESIQVTSDDNGNESAAAVASGWAATNDGTNDVNAAANGVQTPATPNGEITQMAWAE